MTLFKSRFEFKVLIVEDDLFLLDTISDIISDSGFNVQRASNGSEAMKILLTEKIHFVVSDIQMPQKNGIDLLKEIKGNKNIDVSVLMMTGYADTTKEAMLSLGALNLISKPDDLMDVPEVILSMYNQLNSLQH